MTPNFQKLSALYFLPVAMLAEVSAHAASLWAYPPANPEAFRLPVPVIMGIALRQRCTPAGAFVHFAGASHMWEDPNRRERCSRACQTALAASSTA